MNNGGDAAEQIVRLSLEGFEVAAKLTGTAAKELTVLLVSVLRQEQRTKGKARLTNMLKSGKELKVFSVPQKDLKMFTEQAKKYGVLYCVLRDKFNKDDNAPVDIIARAEDASKIQRKPLPFTKKLFRIVKNVQCFRILRKSRWEHLLKEKVLMLMVLELCSIRGAQTLDFVFQPFDCIQLNRNGLQIREIF